MTKPEQLQLETSLQTHSKQKCKKIRKTKFGTKKSGHKLSRTFSWSIKSSLFNATHEQIYALIWSPFDVREWEIERVRVRVWVHVCACVCMRVCVCVCVFVCVWESTHLEREREREHISSQLLIIEFFPYLHFLAVERFSFEKKLEWLSTDERWNRTKKAKNYPRNKMTSLVKDFNPGAFYLWPVFSLSSNYSATHWIQNKLLTFNSCIDQYLLVFE